MVMKIMCVCTGTEDNLDDAMLNAEGQAAYYKRHGLETKIEKINDTQIAVLANGAVTKVTSVEKFE